jgi:UDP-N-acetylglucosamine transferase subunit ALG13
MGSILMALQYGKPIVVMPRRGELRETRNDHQVATAIRFKSLGKIAVAMDEQELPGLLDAAAMIRPADSISAEASKELIDAIRDFIHESDLC